MCLIHQESTTMVYDDASLQYTGDVSEYTKNPLHWSMMTLALQYTGDVSDTPRIYYTGL